MRLLGSGRSLFILLLITFVGCEENGCEKFDDELCISRGSEVGVKVAKSVPSKAVRHVRGRLGNHLAGYMMALTFSLT